MSIWQKFSIRISSHSRKSRVLGWWIGLLLLLFLCVVAGILWGSTTVDFDKVYEAIRTGHYALSDFRIVWYIRIPRVVAAVLAGSGLAVAGVIIQATLNNAMAAPNIIGVNAGAGFCVILTMTVLPAAVHLFPVAAFVGAMGASLIIYIIAAKTGASRMTITLVGIAVASILTAGINAIKTVFPDSLYNANEFMVGGLSGVTYSQLYPACFIIIVSLIIAFVWAKDIDVLLLGEEVAAGVGMNVKRTRFLFLVLASALAGSAVSFAGLIGFVGLVVPHIMRKIVGNRHKLLIPASAIGGAVLVLLCDLVSRTMFAPYELPVGIVLSFVGGPFFIVLILVQRKTKVI